jgi:dephospho-CoA kinase
VLRVGLTGGLGSGKSTVAALLRAHGAEVIEADELGRTLMEPGQSVFNQIVAHFGECVLSPDGHLNRQKLAALVFTPLQEQSGNNRLQELNSIIHPAVIQAQFDWTDSIFRKNPSAIAGVESALIFEVTRDARLRGESETLLADWRSRFDFLVMVTAPEELRIARYISKLTDNKTISLNERVKIIADAHSRIAHQIPDAEKIPHANFVVENTETLAELQVRVNALWTKLQTANTAA